MFRKHRDEGETRLAQDQVGSSESGEVAPRALDDLSGDRVVTAVIRDADGSLIDVVSASDHTQDARASFAARAAGRGLRASANENNGVWLANGRDTLIWGIPFDEVEEELPWEQWNRFWDEILADVDQAIKEESLESQADPGSTVLLELTADSGPFSLPEMATAVAEGLSCVFAAQLTRREIWLAPAEVAMLGDRESVHARARANLAALTWDDYQHPEIPTGADVHVFQLTQWGASKALVLDDVLERQGLDAPLGVLFIIPRRDVLALHIIESGATLVPSVTELEQTAMELFRHDGDLLSLSKDVFYYRDGVIERISYTNGLGEVSVDLVGRYADAYQAAMANDTQTRIDAQANSSAPANGAPLSEGGARLMAFIVGNLRARGVDANLSLQDPGTLMLPSGPVDMRAMAEAMAATPEETWSASLGSYLDSLATS